MEVRYGKTKEKYKMKCSQCNKEASQLHPYPLCDWHWVLGYSYQTYDGKKYRFQEALKLVTKHGKDLSDESQARSAVKEYLSTVVKG